MLGPSGALGSAVVATIGGPLVVPGSPERQPALAPQIRAQGDLTAKRPEVSGAPIARRPGALGTPARSVGTPRRRPGSAHAAEHAAHTRHRRFCSSRRTPPAAACDAGA